MKKSQMQRRPSTLKRSALKRKPMKPLTRSQRLKVHDELCRACGGVGLVDGAHVIARSISHAPDATEAVIPLCRECHQAAHNGTLEILSLLTLAEQHAAIDAAGSLARAFEILTLPHRVAA